MFAIGYAIMAVFLGVSLAIFAIGGHWLWLVLLISLAYGTILDEIAGDNRKPAADWPRFYDALLFATAPFLVVLTFLYVRHLGQASDDPSLAVRLSLLLGGGLSLGMLYGAAGTVVAHELIHRPFDSYSHLLGRWLLSFTFDAAFAIVHVHCHHRYVATPRDTATARRGETLYAFFRRSTLTGWRTAWEIETARLARAGAPVLSRRNRMLTGWAMSLVWVAAAFALGGPLGVAGYLVAATTGKFYLEAVNYIEHYGLVRVEGRPVEARHSWDSARLMTSYILYNLTRHADHHLAATRPFWRLEARPAAPAMPFGYQTMMLIALAPPRFFRLMAEPLARWDGALASPDERALIGAGAAAV